MTLNNAIKLILEHPDTKLSAEAINALHGATEGHPWAEGKGEIQRAREALCVLAGRQIPRWLVYEVERAAKLGAPT